MSGIPFDQISAAALACAPSLLADWFPHGKRCGHEFKIGSIRGEPGDSLSVNLNTGVWSDFAAGGSGGADLISLRAAMAYGGKQGAAARELAQSFGISVNGAGRYPGKSPRQVEAYPTKASTASCCSKLSASRRRTSVSAGRMETAVGPGKRPMWRRCSIAFPE
jgi:hypothetical protein